MRLRGTRNQNAANVCCYPAGPVAPRLSRWHALRSRLCSAAGLISAVLLAAGCRTPFGPFSSKTFSQTEKAYHKLCKDGESTTRENASAAVDLLNHALAQPDLKPAEREALNRRYEAAQESARFLEFVAHSWERFGPGIQSSDPYVNETALQNYLAELRKGAAGLQRAAYREAVDKQIVKIERQTTEITRHIRNLEQEYSFSLTEVQHGFIQKAAKSDVALARNEYKAGRRPWYWFDDKDRIARGIRPVRRVEASPLVHASIRSDADRLDELICSALSQTRIDRELQKPPLPAYERELNYPGNSEMAKKEWVRSRWQQSPNKSLETPLKIQ